MEEKHSDSKKKRAFFNFFQCLFGFREIFFVSLPQKQMPRGHLKLKSWVLGPCFDLGCFFGDIVIIGVNSTFEVQNSPPLPVCRCALSFFGVASRAAYNMKRGLGGRRSPGPVRLYRPYPERMTEATCSGQLPGCARHCRAEPPGWLPEPSPPDVQSTMSPPPSTFGAFAGAAAAAPARFSALPRLGAQNLWPPGLTTDPLRVPVQPHQQTLLKRGGL